MPTSKPKYREASAPQLSANQLAQYLLAGPATRKRIVQAARYQSTAVVARYRHAREAIVSCLCDDTRSPAKVAAARAAMETRMSQPTNSSWTVDDLESSIAALDRYAATANQTILHQVRCQPISGSVPPLVIRDLRIKVTPDVILRRKTKDGEAVGALVTAIAKGEKSKTNRQEQARTAALLVWRFAEGFLTGTVERQLCLSYDVFDGSVYAPSANYVTKLKNIEAACEEIMDKWPNVPPPDDYDG